MADTKVSALPAATALAGTETVVAVQGGVTVRSTVLGFHYAAPPIAQLATSSTVGGNARGTNSVDWQTNRSAATHVASGLLAVVVGGSNNAASGTQSYIGGGNFNTATTTLTVVGGGDANAATGDRSWIPGGSQASTRAHVGRGAWGAGNIAATGDAQAGEYVLRKQTADATLTRITADAAAASTGNTINLPNFAAYAGRLIVVAKQAGAVNAAVWRIDVAAARGSGVATVVLIDGTSAGVAPTSSTGTVTGWALTIAADTTNGGIAISGTGAAATTINWVARYMDIEVVTAS